MPEEKKSEVFIYIEPKEKNKDIPEYVQGMLCCGEPAQDSFGLAGGGFGVYNYCAKCGKIVSKSIVNE